MQITIAVIFELFKVKNRTPSSLTDQLSVQIAIFGNQIHHYAATVRSPDEQDSLLLSTDLNKSLEIAWTSNPEEMHRLHCMLSQLLFTWILSSIYQIPKQFCFNCVLSGKKTNSQGLFRTVTPFNGQESGTRELLVEIEPSITCDWFSVSENSQQGCIMFLFLSPS